MRYDSSMYNGLYTGPVGTISGPYNNVAATQAYFAETTEVDTDPMTATGAGAGMPGADMGSAMPMAADGAPVDSADHNGLMGRPATWWFTLFIVFGVMVFISRRYGGDQKFGNFRPSLWNLALSTVFIILMLNFLKVVFAYLKVPGLSTLVAAA